MNQIQFNELVYPMVYVIAILMLPFNTRFFVSLIISLTLGISIDAVSDTFGLHTSAILFISYLRPYVLKIIRPRDGYDESLSPSIHDMGRSWFLIYASILLSAHHLWFFAFEMLSLNLIGIIILKTFLSTICSLFVIILLQYLLYKPSKQ
jgi:hypothetical protein